MKKLLVYVLIFVLSISFAYPDAEDFAAAKKLIDAKTPCSKLTENQLELIGDYFMEQMHPGEAHEVMDKMMGGEGSESLRLMHIAIAKRIYCNDLNGSINYGFGGMMGLGYRQGGMMNMMWGTNFGQGYGMMGSYGYWGFNSFLTTILLLGLVVLVFLWIVKLWKETFGKAKGK